MLENLCVQDTRTAEMIEPCGALVDKLDLLEQLSFTVWCLGQWYFSKCVKILISCLCRMSLSELLITTNDMAKVQLSSNILGTGLDSI